MSAQINRIFQAFCLIIASLATSPLLAQQCGEQGFFPSVYPASTVPDEDRFEMSQAYPDSVSDDVQPWLAINPFLDPARYMDAVLSYSLEGNIDVDFKGQDNAIRKWYHAPWLHDDGHRFVPEDERGEHYRGMLNAGREALRGMTRERSSPPEEIHQQQDQWASSWAVGMYNAKAALTLKKVWCTDDGIPDASRAVFEEGSVGFKLLFTTASTEQVPFLENTLVWQANTYQCSRGRNEECWERSPRDLRLLQIDIAVKDDRASQTGWFFGTYMYDAASAGDTVWDRMEPVGLAWGDDQLVFQDMNRDGAFVNPQLNETWLNTALIEDSNREYTNEAYIRYHGLGGRLNGPIDNPTSSCISCHGQAAVTIAGEPMPMANFSLRRESFPLGEFIKYFSTVPGESRRRTSTRRFEGQEYINLDYSLQLAFGIRGFHLDRLQNGVQLEGVPGLAPVIDPAAFSAVSRGEPEIE